MIRVLFRTTFGSMVVMLKPVVQHFVGYLSILRKSSRLPIDFTPWGSIIETHMFGSIIPFGQVTCSKHSTSRKYKNLEPTIEPAINHIASQAEKTYV
ncbi:MAG: hypothetical protein Hyperionvirus14_4 [Hyperionvirus sp.]|uniref:Uncharacterized protein n=1 Tax=Hyperionvirus sp. TaxID=2487770 RepID=A0A3G5A9L4_9VIRU|nr:MAG: hypothetical protein Hyperionvirus14_4 [Hyperionvirus sp.]